MGNLRDGAPGERLPRLAGGMVALPPSKSQTLRVLMLAAAARQRAVLMYEHGEGWGEAGDDIKRGIECVTALGGDVVCSGSQCVVTQSDEEASAGCLRVGESGFLGRVAPTCASLCRPGLWEVEATGSLVGRESSALWEALSGAGVEVRIGGGWITSVSPSRDLGVLRLSHPASSQELSAIWLALAARGGGKMLMSGDVPSAPYLEITRAALRSFGATVTVEEGGFGVSGVTHGPTGPISIEVDASAAAVALAAGCLAGVGVKVPGPIPGSPQGDWRVVEHLRAFGCVINEGEGELVAVGGPCRGAELDLSGEPDLAPVLAAVAARSATGGASSVLSGLRTLDGKETRRGETLQRGLAATGHACTWDGSVLKIGPGVGPPMGGDLDSEGDHRMAFAFALLGIGLPELTVLGGRCTAKTWPNFWKALG